MVVPDQRHARTGGVREGLSPQQGTGGVTEAVLVGAGVARQGVGRHVGTEVAEAVLVEGVGAAVLVGVGMGTHGEAVSVGAEVLGGAVALVGAAVPVGAEVIVEEVALVAAGVLWAGVVVPGWVLPGCGRAVVAGLSAAFAALARVAARAADAGLAGLAGLAGCREVLDAEGAGVRSEAGRARTPWRYASAMAVTIWT